VKGSHKYNTVQCAVFDYDELVDISAPECFMLREGVKENFQPASMFVEIFYFTHGLLLQELCTCDDTISPGPVTFCLPRL